MSEAVESELKTLGRVLGVCTKLSVLVQSGYILEGLSDIYLKRNALPEPFDVADHIGNFKEGSLVTAAACGLIGMFACFKARETGTAEEFKKRAKLTAAAAFVASSIVQIVGEKYGINNVIGGHNTPDMIDAAYGIVWSGVTAGATYRFATKTDERLRVEKTQRDSEWAEWREVDRKAIEDNQRIIDAFDEACADPLNALYFDYLPDAQ